MSNKTWVGLMAGYGMEGLDCGTAGECGIICKTIVTTYVVHGANWSPLPKARGTRLAPPSVSLSRCELFKLDGCVIIVLVVPPVLSAIGRSSGAILAPLERMGMGKYRILPLAIPLPLSAFLQERFGPFLKLGGNVRFVNELQTGLSKQLPQYMHISVS